MFDIINGVIYTLSWIICVYSGAQGRTILPLFLGAISLFIQLYYLYYHRLNFYYQNLFLMLFALSLGFCMELLFVGGGILRYSTQNTLWISLPPAWILILYPLFALTVNHSLSYFSQHLFLFCLLGLFGGPMSYYAGSRMKAVNFLGNNVVDFVVIGFVWMLFMALLYFFNQKLKEIVSNVLKEKKELTVLYDGECPICAKEISHLKKKDKQKNVDFVDIASEKYQSKDFCNIEYLDAMKQMHAIEGNEKILQGLDVFTELYVRCGYPFLSILLQLPVLRNVFKYLYKIFAKYRLFLTRRRIPTNRD